MILSGLHTFRSNFRYEENSDSDCKFNVIILCPYHVAFFISSLSVSSPHLLFASQGEPFYRPSSSRQHFTSLGPLWVEVKGAGLGWLVTSAPSPPSHLTRPHIPPSSLINMLNTSTSAALTIVPCSFPASSCTDRHNRTTYTLRPLLTQLTRLHKHLAHFTHHRSQTSQTLHIT